MKSKRIQATVIPLNALYLKFVMHKKKYIYSVCRDSKQELALE